MLQTNTWSVLNPTDNQDITRTGWHLPERSEETEIAEPQLAHVKYGTGRIPCARGMVACQGDLFTERSQAGSCEHRLPSLTSSLSTKGESVTQ